MDKISFNLPINNVEHNRVSLLSKLYIWSVVIEKLNLYKPKSILELGCGNGQLSSLIYDKGFKNYLGVIMNDTTILEMKRILDLQKIRQII